MNKGHLLLITTLLSAGAAIYFYMDLHKCKKYIKALPGDAGSSDGMPPHE